VAINIVMNQIQKSTLEFLSDLKKHNDRDWFLINRKRYEEAKINFESFVQAVINEITTFDPILKGLEVKTCTYRINRDIRFSNDKTIYKTHLGAFIVKGGKQNGDRFAGYYFHVEPGNSMIAGGAYMPPSAWLSAIREKIDEHGKEFLKITSDPDFINYFGAIEGDKLKSAPKGYQKDHPYIELLKLKSFLCARMISDSKITSGGCFEHIISACRIMKPLNDFLNDY
jgi:uncharacterized protein (TIGR02453 family)